MKPLFIPPFVVLSVVLLTVAVSAEWYNVHSDAPMAIPVPYTVKKTTETSITIPTSPVLLPLSPTPDRLPPAPEATVPTGVVRGQTGMESLGGILDTAPPLARGPVEAGTVDPKLIENHDSPDADLDTLTGLLGSGSSARTTSGQKSGQASDSQLIDPLGYGVLVTALIFTTLGLIYMAFIAYDYHQRWVHSLTEHNDRYLGSGVLDGDTEDTYSSNSFPLSDGFGLVRHSI